MVVVDAGIHHRHFHARACEAERILRDVGAGLADGGDQIHAGVVEGDGCLKVMTGYTPFTPGRRASLAT